MGLGGISIWQLLIILLIVVMLFGTKRLRDVGEDLGKAVKGFRKALKSDESGEVSHKSKRSEITDDKKPLTHDATFDSHEGKPEEPRTREKQL